MGLLVQLLLNENLDILNIPFLVYLSILQRDGRKTVVIY